MYSAFLNQIWTFGLELRMPTMHSHKNRIQMWQPERFLRIAQRKILSGLKFPFNHISLHSHPTGGVSLESFNSSTLVISLSRTHHLTTEWPLSCDFLGGTFYRLSSGKLLLSNLPQARCWEIYLLLEIFICCSKLLNNKELSNNFEWRFAGNIQENKGGNKVLSFVN